MEILKWYNGSWTEYIVYKWIGEIDPEGGRTFNGSEILNADEEIIRIKESEALSWKNALGSLKPPNGVSIFALKGSQGYCIVCRRWRMGLIIILLPWIMVSGYALIQVIQSLASTSNVSVSIVLLSGGAFVLGCTLLVDELINKTILMLTPEGGRFIENGIFENHWDIPLSPETDIRYRIKYNDIRAFELKKYSNFREIVIRNKGEEELRFGSSTPNDVQDYFCVCLSRWATGQPLIVSQLIKD